MPTISRMLCEVLGLREDVAREARRGRTTRRSRSARGSAGCPAATSAPKTTIRISSVSGSESISAFLKSSPSVSSSALSIAAPPTSSIRRSGDARPALATAASIGSTRSSAVSRSPSIVNVASAARWSGDSFTPESGPAPGDVRELAGRRRRVRAVRRRATARRRRGGGSAPARSAGSSGKSARSITRSAAPESPLPPSLESMTVPLARPPARQATTKRNQTRERPPGVVCAPVGEAGWCRRIRHAPTLAAGARRLPSDARERSALAPADDAASSPRGG